MNIINTISDKNLFRPFLQDKKGILNSWNNWNIALRALYGLKIKPQHFQLIKDCTGRDISQLPSNGFSTALFLTGRRSGKSRIAAVIAGYEAVFSGKEKLLAKGETGYVPVVSPTRIQSQICKNYLRALFQTPMLETEIVQEDNTGFELCNNVRIQILTGDFRAVRGFSLLAAIVDEAAFFGYSEESRVRSDSELIRAIKPGLATLNGRLICISSPYAKKGYCYSAYKRNYGNDNGTTLVWNCPSRIMNPLLPQAIVDEALQEDLAAAKSEYMGEFRDDIAIFLPREVIEAVVVKSRIELLPRKDICYAGFADVSGGRNDDAALCIGHKDGKIVVQDFLKRYKPPHSPYEVIRSMCEEIKKYGIKSVIGDNYSAEFVCQAFQQNGIRYAKSELNKSQLYLELLPRICSDEIELLEDENMINQLSNLERRTRSGGRDIVDHPQGGKDDCANVTAGVCVALAKPKIFAGGGFRIGNKNILVGI